MKTNLPLYELSREVGKIKLLKCPKLTSTRIHDFSSLYGDSFEIYIYSIVQNT